ncbi:MAG: hypothetical protein J5801_04225 [Bacteroidales bacterium]|nr:hypothetical protein [Bacteroidales bacterium]
MAEDMISALSAKVEKLISMYEAERSRNASLSEEAESYRTQIAQYKEKQSVLEQKVNTLEDKLHNLQLAGAFTASPGDSAGAKRRLNAVIKEIDECIAMLG